MDGFVWHPIFINWNCTTLNLNKYFSSVLPDRSGRRHQPGPGMLQPAGRPERDRQVLAPHRAVDGAVCPGVWGIFYC